MSESVTISVVGTPAPQGSKRHVGGGRMVESSAAVKPWREAVKHAALDVSTIPMTGPVVVEIAFFVRRPKSHYGTGRNAATVKASAPPRPMGKPDIDKLARSTLDGLSGVCYVDDAQVASLVASKYWRDPLAVVGAVITVAEVTG